MKKKILGSLVLLLILTTMTGCVKYNATMDIKADKSMNFDIIYAFDTNFFGEQQLLKDDERKNVENKGFKVTDYVSGTMKGFTISKEIKNIDKVSVTDDVNYSLGMLFESEEVKEEYFKVEKGFLKNKYTANMDFDSSSSSLNDSSSSEDDDIFNEEENYEWDQQDDWNSIDDGLESEDYSDLEDDDSEFGSDEETNEDDDFDFSSMSEMDLSFQVKLPYKAISNNATNVNDDGKSLEWELTTDEATSIEFSFELYNMTTIYFLIGVVSLIVIILIVIIILGIRKSREKKNTYNDISTSVGKTQSVEPISMSQNVESVEPQSIQPVSIPKSVEPVIPQVVPPVMAPQSAGPLAPTQQNMESAESQITNDNTNINS